MRAPVRTHCRPPLRAPSPPWPPGPHPRVLTSWQRPPAPTPLESTCLHNQQLPRTGGAPRRLARCSHPYARRAAAAAAALAISHHRFTCNHLLRPVVRALSPECHLPPPPDHAHDTSHTKQPTGKPPPKAPPLTHCHPQCVPLRPPAVCNLFNSSTTRPTLCSHQSGSASLITLATPCLLPCTWRSPLHVAQPPRRNPLQA